MDILCELVAILVEGLSSDLLYGYPRLGKHLSVHKIRARILSPKDATELGFAISTNPAGYNVIIGGIDLSFIFQYL